MFECEDCGREFKTKSGLISHVKARHPIPAEILAAEGSGPRPVREAVKGALKASEKDMLSMALKALGIERSDVMAHKVYGDRVVIIEGPVGYKRIYKLEA